MDLDQYGRVRSVITTRTILSDSGGIARLGPQPGRLAIMVSQSGGGTFGIQLGTQSGQGFNFGVRYTSTTTPVVFSYRDWGAGLDDEIILSNSAASPVTFTVIESQASLQSMPRPAVGSNERVQ